MSRRRLPAGKGVLLPAVLVAWGCGGSSAEAPVVQAAPAPAAAAPSVAPAEAAPASASAAAPAAPAGPAEPVVTAQARASLDEGLRLMASDKPAALAALQRAREQAPGLYLAHFDAAALLADAGKLPAAREAYEAALRVKPDDAAAAVGLAVTLQLLGDPVQAEAVLQPRAKQAEAGAALAQLYARNHRLAEARKQAVDVLEQDERNAGAMLALGMVYRRQGMSELAEVALTQAAEIDPARGEIQNELGLVFLGRDDRTRALAAFEKAALVSPGVAAVLSNLGVLRTAVGAYKTAVEVLERAVALEPARAEYQLNLGNALRGDLRIADAEKAYLQASTVSGGTPSALFNLGVLYLDNEVPGHDLLDRNRSCITYLRQYREKVRPTGAEAERLGEYLDAAQSAIDNEEKRLARDRQRADKEAREAEKAAHEAQAPKPAVAAPGPAVAVKPGVKATAEGEGEPSGEVTAASDDDAKSDQGKKPGKKKTVAKSKKKQKKVKQP